MNKWKWFCGGFGGGVAWFRIKGYGFAAIKGLSFSTRNGYHKMYFMVGGWRVEALAP